MIENSYYIIGGNIQALVMVLFSFILVTIAINFLKKL